MFGLSRFFSFSHRPWLHRIMDNPSEKYKEWSFFGFGSFPFVPPPPALCVMSVYYLQPPPTLCNGTSSVTRGRIVSFWGGGGKRKRSKVFIEDPGSYLLDFFVFRQFLILTEKIRDPTGTRIRLEISVINFPLFFG